MEINPTDSPIHLVKADIIKPLEACARDLSYAMVRHQEVLLPAHEDVLALRPILAVEVGPLSLALERPPGGEARPVQHVDFVGGAPGGVACLEGVFATDDLAFEVSG